MSSSDDDSESEAIERTLCSLPECFVYKIPPASSSEGYYASGWKKQIWSGPLRIIAKGKECRVELYDSSDNSIFATCYIEDDPPSVEGVKDSSRYFVLRIVNERGKKAYIGIGFQQRSDAFDFNVTIQDHKKQAKEEDNEDEEEEDEEEDFSLGKGEKISLNVNVKGSGGGGLKERGPVSIKAHGGVLAPPPAASGRSRAAKSSGRSRPKPKASKKRRDEEEEDEEDEDEGGDDFDFM